MAVIVDQRPGEATSDANNPYPNLRRSPSLQIDNQGGKFALPPEFDRTKWASAYYLEGNESLAMQQPQVLQGTDLIADGWAVWKYPEERIISVPDEESGGMKEDIEKHPSAGQPHRVHGLKPGEVWLLHCRPLEVQDDVNRVYGEQSREQMIREIQGDTFTQDEGMSPSGMLTNRMLKAEIGAEAEIEQMRKDSAAVIQTPAQPRGKKSQRVSR